MSKNIYVDSNRTLKLKNVLTYTMNLSNAKEENYLDKRVIDFENYIKNHGLQKVGPFIVQTVLKGGDEPAILLKFLQQIRNEDFKPIAPYEMTEEIKTGQCLYSHFEGQESDSNIAQSKMQVYAYENDLILDSTSYTVYIQRDESGNCIVDNFTLILGRRK